LPSWHLPSKWTERCGMLERRHGIRTNGFRGLWNWIWKSRLRKLS